MLFRCAREEKLRRFISFLLFLGFVCMLPGNFLQPFLLLLRTEVIKKTREKVRKIKVRVTIWCDRMIKNCWLYLEKFLSVTTNFVKFTFVHTMISYFFSPFCPHTLTHKWCEFFFSNARKNPSIAHGVQYNNPQLWLMTFFIWTYTRGDEKIVFFWKNEKNFLNIFHRLDFYSNKTTLPFYTNWQFPFWYACKGEKASSKFHFNDCWKLDAASIRDFHFPLWCCAQRNHRASQQLPFLELTTMCKRALI